MGTLAEDKGLGWTLDGKMGWKVKIQLFPFPSL